MKTSSSVFRRRIASALSVIAFTTLLLTCKNPLLQEIEEVVEVVVTPPEVLAIYPEENAVDIPITLNTITVTFSKSIQGDSLTSSTFYVQDPSENKVTGVTKVETDTITFTPTSSLAVGTSYTVVINGIRDTDGNAIAGEYSWNFTTGIEGDTVVPVTDSITINNGDSWTNNSTVQVDIEATDNFGVAQMNVSLNGSFSESNWVTFSDSFSLVLPDGDGMKTVYIKLKDGSGNLSSGSASDTIGLDTSMPSVTAFQIDGGNSGTRNTTVDIDIIAEDENDGSGIAWYRFHREGEEWSSWTPLTGGSAFLDDTALSVSADETEVFYLQVRDNAGNLSEITTEQITLDLTAPEVDPELSNPEPNSTVPLNQAYIKVAFDGEMNTSTITSDTVYVSRGATKISTPQYSLTDGNSAVEFSYFEDGGDEYFLEQNTSYTIFISSAVSDIAGNTMSGDYSYYFTTDLANDSTAPDGTIVLDLDNPDFNATKGQTIDLQIKAEDDYNGVRAVKFWGDGGTGMPIFEADASWILYSENAQTTGLIDYMSYDAEDNAAIDGSQEWLLSDTGGASGDRYIYYRFSDFAGNESPTPGRLKINLDNTDPVLNSVQINSGTGYTINNVVNIALDAEDVHSGLQYVYFYLEAADTVGSPTFGASEDWITLKTGYDLSTETGASTGEGRYFLHVAVEDHVGLPLVLAPEYTTVVWDETEPSVSFDSGDILEANSPTIQTSTISDPDPGAAAYEVPSGIASYSWEQVSGPGTLSFWANEGATVAGSDIETPYVKAAEVDGSEDGTYEIKLTVTDNAGNSSYSTVPFYWDTIDPDDVGTITVYNEDASILTTSATGSVTYTTSAQPYVEWAGIANADFYIFISAPDSSNDPNVDPGFDYPDGNWYPHWDDDQVDWDIPATYESKRYLRTDIPYLSAPAPDAPGDNDGEVYLYLSAWDNAGNRSNRTSDKMVRFWIDTLAPVITDVQPLDPHNIAYEIDFRNSNSLGDGRVYDQRTADDPDNPGTQGSGLTATSYLWEQNAGPGTLTITDADTISPVVSAASDGSEDGQYELKLTVTDIAGNQTEDYVSFVWDTTDPNPVTVSGPDHTPDLSPTWSWTSGGGGNGTFEYQLEYSSGGVVSGYSWTTTTDTFFTPTANLVTAPAKDYFTLYVREKDDAGNDSDELNPVSSHEIYVDWEHKTEPAVSRSGAYLRNGDTLTVTWNMGSGIGEPASEYYRYWIENDSGGEVMYGSGGSAQVIGPFTSGNATVDVDISSLADGIYHIKVQEFDSVNYDYVMENAEGWDSTNGYIGSSSLQKDAQAPAKPTINTSYTTGGATTYNGYHLSNDTTPRFWWNSGGGGNGTYRWSFDESDWTETSYYYVYTSNDEGLHTFYVQERDTAGNWSDSTEFNLEIDVTAPTLSSILLSNRHTNAVNTTSYTVSPYVNIDVTGSGSNTQTHPASDIRYMRFWNSGGSTYTYTYNSSLSNWYFGNGGGSTADGTKYVYCEIQDYAGNVSVTRSDGIVLDSTEPVISSFSINSGSTTATSTSTILSSSYTGANYMRMSNDGGSTWSGWYTASSSRSWTLSTANGYNGYGAKKVVVQFTDYAGYYSRNSVSGEPAHYDEDEDSIFYGTPVMRNSYKGYTSNGYMRTYYEEYPSDTGSTNYYYVYYATSPTGTKTTAGSTTNSSYFSDYYTEGTLYYLFVRVYNADIGYSNYSTYSIGYSSDMAIIYDDDDGDDSSLASLLRSRITTDWPTSNPTNVHMNGYTWSQYSVTLVPEDEIPTSFSSYGNDEYDETVVYGNPVIITPSAANMYANTNRAKNVAFSGKGIMAMHYYGWRFFQTLVNNWGSLGVPGVSPTNLDYAYSRGETQYANIKPYYSQYDYIWHRYMYYSPLWDSYKYTDDYDALMFTNDPEQTYGLANRWSIYNSNESGYDGSTYFWADDPDYSNYYTIARQDRFVYWAYDKVPGYYYGIPLLYNMVRYLNSYY